jgi:HAD superfamily hydrolase (TIGR01450 family)
MRPPDAWILDLDGVVWRGDTPVRGSAEAIGELRRGGARVVFVSNNSATTVPAYLAKLERMGMPTEPGDLVTSAQAAADLVPAGSRALVLGGAGIVEALSGQGVEAIDADVVVASPGIVVDHVVVGIDRRISYERLSVAVTAVLAGATLIGTNEDPTFPTAEGLRPGGGSLVAAVAYAAGVTPVIAGKPHRAIASTTLHRLGRERGAGLLVVGDQPLTDGRFAEALGARFALVLSGVTDAEAATRAVPVPDLVAADLAAVVATVSAGTLPGIGPGGRAGTE